MAGGGSIEVIELGMLDVQMPRFESTFAVLYTDIIIVVQGDFSALEG